LQVGFKHRGVVPGQQNFRCAGCQNHRAIHGRVQGFEVFQAHIGEFGGHRHVDVAFNGDTLEEGVVLDERQLGVEGLGLGNDVFDRLQLGYVKARFVGHAQVAVGQRQTLRFVARQRTAHTAFAPVVGGQGQMPVAKHGVELLQVIECSTGGLQHIAAFVPEQVLFQIEILARGWHELPHACGLGARHGLRVEGRLDEGQQGQLHGHFPAL
jgi:hypothetical protein